MKFKHWNHAEPDLTLIEFVEQNLSASDYERGAVELALLQGENVTSAFARLLEVLATKKMLTKDDVHKIVKGGK